MSDFYLVTHSCAAALSRCRDQSAIRPQRGETVVMRAARGEEIGIVLCESLEQSEAPFSPAELVRRATSDDLCRAASTAALARRIADDAQRLIDELQLPLLSLDADLPLDASSAVIHVLRWSPCTLTPLTEALHERFGIAVYLLDRSQAPPKSAGGTCGSGGCGSCGESSCGSGSQSGCGSGNCSRGTTASELAAYFSELREKMHAGVRTPLL